MSTEEAQRGALSLELVASSRAASQHDIRGCMSAPG
jgi:hypothetical protein